MEVLECIPEINTIKLNHHLMYKYYIYVSSCLIISSGASKTENYYLNIKK